MTPLLFVQVVHHFHYDPQLGLAVCEDGSPESFPFPGVFLWENFISEEEEEQLIKNVDQDVWNKSQSGRQKQVLWNLVFVNFIHYVCVGIACCFTALLKNMYISTAQNVAMI